MARWLPLSFLLLVAACGGYQGVRAPRLSPSNAHWERALNRQALGELACPSVRLIPLGESIVQVDGCSRVVEYALFCFSRRRCDWRPLEGVARRAERDLSCPGAALSISALGPVRRAVLGCGRSASYTLTCSTEHCAWAPESLSPAPPVAVTAVSAVGPGGTDGVVIPPPPGSTTSTDGVVIRPPPGSTTSTDGVVIPPPPGSTTSTDGVVVPPPPGSTTSTESVVVPPPPGSTTSTDGVVIPPPPR
jgi:hypothetical protein